MQQILISRLHRFLVDNNPDLLVQLQQERRLQQYLEDKVGSVQTMIDQLIEADAAPYYITEQCMEALTADLRPSRFYYVAECLNNHHTALYNQLREQGTLTYEVINLLEVCGPVLDDAGFGTVETSPELEATIAQLIRRYLSHR